LFTKRAVEDLTGIWEYTCDTWSDRQADKYYSLLIEACKEIASDHRKGKSYDELAEDMKGYVVQRHIIFLKRTAIKEVLVVRILHAHMDLRGKMKS
jgi:toxin ParE1/3/4